MNSRQRRQEGRNVCARLATDARTCGREGVMERLLRRAASAVFLSATCVGLLCSSPVMGADAGGGFGARVVDGQSLYSPVNTGGPSDWPVKGGLSTQEAIPGGQTAAAMPGGQAQMPTAPLMPAPAMPGSAAGAPSAPAPLMPAPAMPGSGGQFAAPLPAVPDMPATTAQAPSVPPVSPAPSASSPFEPSAPATPPAPTPTPVDPGAHAAAADFLNAAPQTDKKDGAEDPGVIYVDEKGNPVPKPLEPDKMMAEAQELVESGQFAHALPILRQVKDIPTISKNMRLEALYMISDCVWALYKDKPLEGYDELMATTAEALNADLRYERAPSAMLRLGRINLAVNDVNGAGAHIMALYRRYPAYPEVAAGLTELGRAQLRHEMNEQAVHSFSLVLDKYPESSSLERASMGLAQALYNLKRHNDTQTILDFVNKRWPRCYLDDVSFLLMQAANARALGRDETARELLWLYLNLEPKREGNDALLLSMADMYATHNDWPAATVLYQQLVRHWPDADPTITARMRLGEKGLYDAPITYDGMTPVFGQPSEPGIEQLYLKLSEASKTQPSAVISHLKYAMWLLWDKHYTEAMGKAADFVDMYPEHQDVPQARDVIWAAFQKELANSLAEQNYGRILLLWNGFPLVRQRYGPIDSTMRYALAQGYKERGDDGRYLALISEFLKSPKDPRYGEMAFAEYFNRYIRAGAWEKILELAQLVHSWDMSPGLRLQLDYAMALSAQNLNRDEAALAMWRQIARRPEFPLYQRAYATYYLARDAANPNHPDVHAAYTYYKQVLDLFTQLENERSDKSDPLRIKEAIAALMDICEVANRLPEALEWVDRYRAYVPDASSPDYPGLRYREARLYRKLGDTARARALLEDIVAKFPDSPFGQSAATELRSFEVSRDLQNYLGGQSETGSKTPGS